MINPLAADPDAQVGTILRVAQAGILLVRHATEDDRARVAWDNLIDAVEAWAEANPESAARLDEEEG